MNSFKKISLVMAAALAGTALAMVPAHAVPTIAVTVNAIAEAVVLGVPARSTATVITAAFAGVATIVPKVMAATMARASFLNEFILSPC